MKKAGKRCLVWGLTFLMVVGSVPQSMMEVFAEELEVLEEIAESEDATSGGAGVSVDEYVFSDEDSSTVGGTFSDEDISSDEDVSVDDIVSESEDVEEKAKARDNLGGEGEVFENEEEFVIEERTEELENELEETPTAEIEDEIEEERIDDELADNEKDLLNVEGDDVVNEITVNSDLLNGDEEYVSIRHLGGYTRFLWRDGVFGNDSNVSKKNLAVLSGALSAAAEGKGKDEGKDYYMSQAYKDLGFPEENISLYSYPDSDYNFGEAKKVDGDKLKNFADDDNLAFSIAHKQIELPQGKGGSMYLVIITARGSTTNNEFMADATTSASKNFNGYKVYDIVYDFEEDIWAGLTDHFSRHEELETGKIKFLVTGHSLGGAAANLVAARLTAFSGGSWANKDDVYAYTFGAIDSLQEDEGQVENGFDNIFNIYNELDTFGPNGEGFLGVKAAGHFIYNKFGKIFLFEQDYGTGNAQNHAIENYIKAIEDDYIDFDNEDKESVGGGGGSAGGSGTGSGSDISEAESKWYEDYEYEIGSDNQSIVLEKYIGSDRDITIPGIARINMMYNMQVILHGGVFDGCDVDSITIGDGVKIDYGRMMFYRCGAKEIVFEKVDTSNCSSMSNMFFGCINLTELDLSSFDTTGVSNESDNSLVENGSMREMFCGCKKLKSVVLSSFNTSKTNSMCEMFKSCESLTDLDLSNFNTREVTNMKGMFERCYNLESINISGFNTGNVRDMGEMFSWCGKLSKIDVSNFNTENVTNMHNMFYGCEELTDLNVSSFDTGMVTDMGEMFGGCENLTSLDLSYFETSNVTKMSDLFIDCESLTYLDLSTFDTSKVTDMGAMFLGCENLTDLNMSSFDTSNVKDMSDMFNCCESLTHIDVFNFDTRNVTNMRSMFNDCKYLSDVNLSNFDTSKVEDMSYMFRNCNSIFTINLSHFDTKKVRRMDAMFAGCTNLQNLDVSHWDTKNVTDFNYMFNGCDKLKCLDLSSFDMTGMSIEEDEYYTLCNVEKLITPKVVCPKNCRMRIGKMYAVEDTVLGATEYEYLGDIPNSSTLYGNSKSLTDAVVSMDSSSYTYRKNEDGSRRLIKQPIVYVRMNGVLLKEGVHYTCAYTLKFGTGIGMLEVRGKNGVFAGTVQRSFNLVEEKHGYSGKGTLIA